MAKKRSSGSERIGFGVTGWKSGPTGRHEHKIDCQTTLKIAGEEEQHRASFVFQKEFMCSSSLSSERPRGS